LSDGGRSTKRGMYIYGPVGTGKTMLMRMFAEKTKEVLPTEMMHYDEFVDRIQKQMWALRKEDTENSTGIEIIKKVAASFRRDFRVLCLDEMQMQDVASAILIRQVLTELMLDKGFCLVSTSNLNVEDLCTKGLHAHRIGDFQSILSKKLKVVTLEGKDYRNEMSAAPRDHKVFFYPLNRDTQQEMTQSFEELSKFNMVREDSVLELSGSNLNIPKMGTLQDGRHIAWFDFEDLCQNNLGPSDYIVIANNFAAIFIANVPQFTNQRSNQARRFITLVDQLYNQRVKLSCTMAVPIDQLFNIERLNEKEFDHSLELAEDQLNLKAKTIAESNVWHADNVKAGLSLGAIFEGGKAEEFAAVRTKSRLNEMSGVLYWKDLS